MNGGKNWVYSSEGDIAVEYDYVCLCNDFGWYLHFKFEFGRTRTHSQKSHKNLNNNDILVCTIYPMLMSIWNFQLKSVCGRRNFNIIVCAHHVCINSHEFICGEPTWNTQNKWNANHKSCDEFKWVDLENEKYFHEKNYGHFDWHTQSSRTLSTCQNRRFLIMAIKAILCGLCLCVGLFRSLIFQFNRFIIWNAQTQCVPSAKIKRQK